MFTKGRLGAHSQRPRVTASCVCGAGQLEKGAESQCTKYKAPKQRAIGENEFICMNKSHSSSLEIVMLCTSEPPLLEHLTPCRFPEGGLLSPTLSQEWALHMPGDSLGTV